MVYLGCRPIVNSSPYFKMLHET